MKNCLLILSIILINSTSYAQNLARNQSVNTSPNYFKYNSFNQQDCANKSLFTNDSILMAANSDFLVNKLNQALLTDSLESLINVRYVLTREEYQNMPAAKQLALKKFIKSIYFYTDALAPMNYPKQTGYFLPDQEINTLQNILNLN
jgi:hypothetical protein